MRQAQFALVPIRSYIVRARAISVARSNGWPTFIALSRIPPDPRDDQLVEVEDQVVTLGRHRDHERVADRAVAHSDAET